MKQLTSIIFSLALAALSCGCNPDRNPVLTIEGGQIQGVELPGKITVYRGIPYAAPPTGENRFRAPQPVVPWQGVRLMDTFGAIAPQAAIPPGTFYGDEFYWDGIPETSEDCLFLNIWAPTPTLGKTEARLPVAIWIHGGAYDHGYAHEITMDGTAWAERGVILVTINYRLGVFGFLSHPELTAEQGASGNYGTMDQAAAVKWVHDNIAQFGGDPENITVLGQSAGAMSVKTLLVSPLSKNLISKAIIQSGGGIGRHLAAPGNMTLQPIYDQLGKAVMDNSGLTTLADLREAPTETVFAAQGKYKADGKGSVRFSPHPDKNVLPTDFDPALYGGTLAPVPILIGYNKDDMRSLAGENVDRFCAVRDSLGFPVYEYEFLRNLPGDDQDPAKDPGAFHSAELWYMFGTLDKSRRPFTEADHALSEEMLSAWTSFCKSGNPGWEAYKHDKPFKKLFDVPKD